MARKRFARLGWTNVKVICQDARAFRLHEHEPQAYERKEMISKEQTVRDLDENADAGGAELVTMSYALSMIPEFYPVIDSIDSLMSPNGVIGVVDFYVQNQVDFMGRNYMGGAIDRHCMWISRVFWRTWFEIDRVNLEPARRVCKTSMIQAQLLMICRTTWSTALAQSLASTLATTSSAPVSSSPTSSGSVAQKTMARPHKSLLRLMPLLPNRLTLRLSTSRQELHRLTSKYTRRPTNPRWSTCNLASHSRQHGTKTITGASTTTLPCQNTPDSTTHTSMHSPGKTT